MTPPHTLETLLPLLTPSGNPASPEAEEKLRILTAEAAGWVNIGWQPRNCFSEATDRALGNDKDWWRLPAEKEVCVEKDLPYPTSLDAIYAAESRLGLHKEETPSDLRVRSQWETFATQVYVEAQESRYKVFPRGCHFAFLTPAQRCIPFILTAQWLKEQEGGAA